MKVYLYLGNESLIIENKITQLIKQLAPDSLSPKIYDLEGDSDEKMLKEALYDAKIISIFDPVKVIILKNPYFLTQKLSMEVNSDFINFLTKPLGSTLLIIRGDGYKINEELKLVKALLKNAEIINTMPLNDVQFKAWLQRQFEIDKIKVEPKAIDIFIKRVNFNLEKAKSEIDKLKNYLGDQKNVTVEDVEKLVTHEFEANVFHLVSALFNHEYLEMTKIYEELMFSGISPQQILGVITGSLCDILATKLMTIENYPKAKIAKILSKTDARMHYILKDSQKFDYDEIKEKVQNLSVLDYKIKTGKLDPGTGLELFLFQNK